MKIASKGAIRESAFAPAPAVARFDEPVAVKSAARAFRIMEYFDEIRRPARANEIAVRLALPQSSTSVMLNSLVRLGYLDFDRHDHTYLPSLRISVLASWRDSGRFRDVSLNAFIERLAHETGLSVGVSRLSGIYVQYFQVLNSAANEELRIKLSTRFYAAWSAVGIVLLARMSDERIKSIVHSTRAESTRAVQRINVTDVLEHVAAARRQHYFFDRGLVAPQAGAIAMRLPASITGESPSTALSVFGPVDQIASQESGLVGLMRRAIHDLEHSSIVTRQMN